MFRLMGTTAAARSLIVSRQRLVTTAAGVSSAAFRCTGAALAPRCLDQQQQLLIVDGLTQQQHRTHATDAASSSSSSEKSAEKNDSKDEKEGTSSKKPKGADAGRIVLFEEGKGKMGKGPRLCAGCGTEVIVGGRKSTNRFLSGTEAVESRERTKKQAKNARFYDTFDGMFKSTFYCQRCKALREENLWKAYDALHDVEPEVFSDQLKHIVARRRFGLCIMVVDATDPEHSAIKHLRRSIGKTPCWLVLNKMDLMPRLNRNDIHSLHYKIRNITGSQYIECFGVSAKTGQGVFTLAENMLMNLRGRDIFVVGCANVGKTTLVQAVAGMIAEAIYMKGKKHQARKDMAAQLPVTNSHLPGTTLQAVRIPCFSSERHALWDTPGIINRKAVQYSLFPSHLMEPLTRPKRIPIPTRENGLVGMVSAGYSILIEAKWMDEDYVEPNDSDDEKEDEDDDDENEEDRQRQHRVDEDGQGGSSKPHSLKNDADSADSSSAPPSDPCVLARIDMLAVEGDGAVYAQAYLHPSLRVRVVPINEAPSKAIIPASHVKRIQDKIKTATRQKRDIFPEAISLPLRIYDTTKELVNGEIHPGDKCQNPNSGKYHMDLSFASLGWIAFTHHGDFTMQPHCIEGSVFSKRRSLYPINLHQMVDNEYMDDGTDEPTDEEDRHRRLADAAKAGRHQDSDFNQSRRSYPGRRIPMGGGGGDYDEEIGGGPMGDLDDDDWF